MDIKWVGCDPSNYTKGRQGNDVKRLVVHWVVGTLESADATFANPQRNASAHYGIGDNDIHRYVKDEDTAWHCGDWLWNLKTIGIEHEGGPNLPISEDTYKSSAMLIKNLCTKYNIPIDREHITGHSDYVATQCPGTFDIDKVIKLAKGGVMEWLGEDIPTEVEEKFNLKNIERYNKYWDFNELIKDWIKLTKEFEDETSKLKEKVTVLEEEVEFSLTQYGILKKEKDSLESNLEALEREMLEDKKKYELDLSVLEQQVQDVSTQYDSLLKRYENLQTEMDEGYGDQIKRLKSTIKDLENRILDLQKPFEKISRLDALKYFFTGRWYV